MQQPQNPFAARLLLAALIGLLPASLGAQPDPHAGHHATEGRPSVPAIPSSIAEEHHELHETLARATREAVALGAAARELEEALAPHFRREEEIASPPLGLLVALASGPPGAQMRSVLPMTEALEREMPRMLREHEAIRAAATGFRAAAEAANRPEYVRFADHLAAHARQEEEILYPAAILVGRYIARTAPGE